MAMENKLDWDEPMSLKPWSIGVMMNPRLVDVIGA